MHTIDMARPVLLAAQVDYSRKARIRLFTNPIDNLQAIGPLVVGVRWLSWAGEIVNLAIVRAAEFCNAADGGHRVLERASPSQIVVIAAAVEQHASRRPRETEAHRVVLDHFEGRATKSSVECAQADRLKIGLERHPQCKFGIAEAAERSIIGDQLVEQNIRCSPSVHGSISPHIKSRARWLNRQQSAACLEPTRRTNDVSFPACTPASTIIATMKQ